MNLFRKFSQHFGSVEGAIAFLSMNGYTVNKGRFNEWLAGKRLPRFEVLNLIMSTVTDVTLTSDVEAVERTSVKVAINTPQPLIDAVPVIKLREKLPHRRFSDDFYSQPRLLDEQVLTAIYGFNVWETFEELCGNMNSALYVLRRNSNGRRITDNWLQNRISDGWYSDTVNVMVTLIRKYKDTGCPFSTMTVHGEPPVITNVAPLSAGGSPSFTKREWVVQNMMSRFGMTVHGDINDEQVEEMYQDLLKPAPIMTREELDLVIEKHSRGGL